MIECCPTERVDILSVATPEVFSVAVVSTVEPSLKLTEPVGVLVPVGVTVAVKVTI